MKTTEKQFAAQVASAEEWKSRGLEFSTLLDPHRWSESPIVRSSVTNALRWCGLDNKTSGHRTLNRRLMTVILQNLFSCYFKDAKLFCSYSRTKNDYVMPKRYNRTGYSFKAVSLIDKLAEQQLIENYLGVQFGDFKRVARMRLTAMGVKVLLKDHGITPALAATTKLPECIVLRDKDAKTGDQVDIAYTDTDNTVKMRERLEAYNALDRPPLSGPGCMLV